MLGLRIPHGALLCLERRPRALHILAEPPFSPTFPPCWAGHCEHSWTRTPGAQAPAILGKKLSHQKKSKSLRGISPQLSCKGCDGLNFRVSPSMEASKWLAALSRGGGNLLVGGWGGFPPGTFIIFLLQSRPEPSKSWT